MAVKATHAAMKAGGEKDRMVAKGDAEAERAGAIFMREGCHMLVFAEHCVRADLPTWRSTRKAGRKNRETGIALGNGR